MGRSTDIRVVGVELYFLPVHTRVPLKFGAETLTSVTCARVRVTVQDRRGRIASGWGETPLNVEWVWPSLIPHHDRYEQTVSLCKRLAQLWAEFDFAGHPLEIGHAFQDQVLGDAIREAQANAPEDQKIPLLAGLLCCSPFDIALYDAYGILHGVPAMATLTRDYLGCDLGHFLQSPDGAATDDFDFRGSYPADYLKNPPATRLSAWHLVGGLDPLSEEEVDESHPNDGHPVTLGDWIQRDGLTCLKIKLRGTDANWDYERLAGVGHIAQAGGVQHLTADFNCTVSDPQYVIEVLDRLASDEPTTYNSLLYIEQPFPHDIETHPIDVHVISERKPLFLDESAHNWRFVRLGRILGWTGVALKTCKTMTGAILSLCWAKAHGMQLMVQDLTNPMLAQIPHVTLAAHTDTIMGVETNAMQFYPAASTLEAQVHPNIYNRSDGHIDLSTLQGPGFGYRVDEIARPLPEPVAVFGSTTAANSSAVPRPHLGGVRDPNA